MLISQSVFALNVESHAEEGAGCAGRQQQLSVNTSKQKSPDDDDDDEAQTVSLSGEVYDQSRGSPFYKLGDVLAKVQLQHGRPQWMERTPRAAIVWRKLSTHSRGVPRYVVA